MTACSSTTQLIRPAPPEGVRVNELNILFMANPPKKIATSGSGTPSMSKDAGPEDLTRPRPQLEKLRDEMKERLVLPIKGKRHFIQFCGTYVAAAQSFF